MNFLLDEAQRGRLALFIGGDLSADITGLPSQGQLAREMAARFGQTVADDQPAALTSVVQRAGRQRTRDVVQSRPPSPPTLGGTVGDLPQNWGPRGRGG